MSDVPWSYSRLKTYELCPKKYYELFVSKRVKEPPSDTLAHGNAVHKALEHRVKYGTPLPKPFAHMEQMAAPFAGAEGRKKVEWELAINRDGKPVKWLAKDVWVRAKVDLAILADDIKGMGVKAMIVDWKTGKMNPDEAQLVVNMYLALRHVPDITRFKAVYVWLKERDVTDLVVESPALKNVWNEEIVPRQEELQAAHRKRRFDPTPNGTCRKWCPVKECPYHGT